MAGTALPGEALPWRVLTDGLLVVVRLTPRGGRDSVDGMAQLSDNRAVLKLRVRVTPTEGEANAALVALLAKVLDVPKSAIAITAGHSARLKTVKIMGHGEVLAEKIQALC